MPGPFPLGSFCLGLDDISLGRFGKPADFTVNIQSQDTQMILSLLLLWGTTL